MNVAIRAQYPAEGEYGWGKSLDDLYPITTVELAFHSPEAFINFVAPEPNHAPLAASLSSRCVNVPTIHMANASLGNLGMFVGVLIGTLRIARAVGCHDIVIHPNYGPAKDFEAFYDNAVLPLLEDYDCNLLWETFPGKRRVLRAWEGLAKFCEAHERSFICYDVCHMQRRTEETIEDIDAYGHLIRGYHFSNWQSVPFKQHLPLGDGVLDFPAIVRHLVRTGFDGSCTLEYLPEYHDQLVPDAKRLLERIYDGQGRG